MRLIYPSFVTFRKPHAVRLMKTGFLNLVNQKYLILTIKSAIALLDKALENPIDFSVRRLTEEGYETN